jgi:hypothetical protein
MRKLIITENWLVAQKSSRRLHAGTTTHSNRLLYKAACPLTGPPQTSVRKLARDQPDCCDARSAFTFHLFFECQDEGGGAPLPSNSDMKIKMKRFLLVTLAACVAIDLVALWMLW